MKKYTISLNSHPAVNDVKWFYQSGEAALGFRAQNIDSSGGGLRPEDIGWKTDAVVRATTRYRAIAARLAGLLPMHRTILQRFFSTHKPRRPEPETFFGPLIEVALLLETEDDLVTMVRKEKKHAEDLASALEKNVRLALDAYHGVPVEEPAPREYTVAQAARELAVSLRTLERQIASGKVASRLDEVNGRKRRIILLAPGE